MNFSKGSLFEQGASDSSVNGGLSLAEIKTGIIKDEEPAGNDIVWSIDRLLQELQAITDTVNGQLITRASKFLDQNITYKVYGSAIPSQIITLDPEMWFVALNNGIQYNTVKGMAQPADNTYFSRVILYCSNAQALLKHEDPSVSNGSRFHFKNGQDLFLDFGESVELIQGFDGNWRPVGENSQLITNNTNIINDALTTSLAKTWSIDKIKTQIAALVNSAPATLDTLNEIATALNNDANFYTTITNLINQKRAKPTKTTSFTNGALDLSIDRIIGDEDNVLNGTYYDFTQTGAVVGARIVIYSKIPLVAGVPQNEVVFPSFYDFQNNSRYLYDYVNIIEIEVVSLTRAKVYISQPNDLEIAANAKIVEYPILDGNSHLFIKEVATHIFMSVQPLEAQFEQTDAYSKSKALFEWRNAGVAIGGATNKLFTPVTRYTDLKVNVTPRAKEGLIQGIASLSPLVQVQDLNANLHTNFSRVAGGGFTAFDDSNADGVANNISPQGDLVGVIGTNRFNIIGKSNKFTFNNVTPASGYIDGPNVLALNTWYLEVIRAVGNIAIKKGVPSGMTIEYFTGYTAGNMALSATEFKTFFKVWRYTTSGTNLKSRITSNANMNLNEWYEITDWWIFPLATPLLIT